MEDIEKYKKNHTGITIHTFGLMFCIARQSIFIFRLNRGEHQDIHIYYPVLSNTILAFTYLYSLLKLELFYETRKYFIPFALSLLLDCIIAVMNMKDNEMYMASRIGMFVQLAFNVIVLLFIFIKAKAIKPYIKIDTS